MREALGTPRLLVLGALVLAVAALGAAPATAGATATVAISGGYAKTVTYTAQSNEASNVLVYAPGAPTDKTLYFQTSGNQVVQSDGWWGCTNVSSNLVKCPGTYTTKVKLIGGEKNDTLVMFPNAAVPTIIEGRGGNDDLTGSPKNDQIYGGDGDDTIYGDAPNTGATGNDQIDGGSGADAIDGSDGTDTVSYASHTADVTASLVTGTGTSSEDGAGDTLANVENLTGGSGRNNFLGDDGPNVLSGWTGNDILRGGGGGDFLVGHAGAFDLLIGDAGPDIMIGGQGDDWYIGGTGSDTMLDEFFIAGGGSNLFYTRDDTETDYVTCDSRWVDSVYAGPEDSIQNESDCDTIG